MTITILSPVGEPIAQPAPSTELAEPRLRGVRLGFLGNTKPNIEVLVDGQGGIICFAVRDRRSV
jgi:hypothetical protein